MKDGHELDKDLRDLELGASLKAHTFNRPPNPTTGVCHGGVAVFYKKTVGSFKKIPLQNPDSFEVLPLVGSLRGSARKIVIIAAYIPPTMSLWDGSALTILNIVSLKLRLDIVTRI